ncbi:MAG: response regulator transcription factor [Oscillospiraceae bacterium]|nr:response regulator transcription factor [Oscillospiraceae bacterium]
MLKIAICDDEKEFRDAAERMLKLYMEDKGVSYQVDTFGVPSDLVDATEEGTIYDIYLLDIYMPGITGMSIATELRSRSVKSPVIFLTSSTDHALEAFGVDATHYLLKHYTKDNFYVGMDKAMQSITSHKDDSIVLKVDNEYRSISISKILYCEAEDKYQRLYLANGERLLVRITGTELYKQLSEFECFYRCGRAHIVNLNHISKVSQNGAVFKDGVQLSLPRTVLAGLRKAFFDYFD